MAELTSRFCNVAGQLKELRNDIILEKSALRKLKNLWELETKEIGGDVRREISKAGWKESQGTRLLRHLSTETLAELENIKSSMDRDELRTELCWKKLSDAKVSGTE